MGKKIKVECFKSDNQDFIVGNTYDAEISLAEKQAFMVFCKTYNGFEVNEDVEFTNGVYDEDRKVGFTVDAKIFEKKFELDLRMSDKGIVCNATTLRAMLPKKLKSYNYVVDVENYDNAKKDRTKLNNLHDLLQKKRMQFEEVELAGWKSEKSILMDIEKTIKEASNALGSGIKAIDEADKTAKMECIRESFNALELPLPITFEQLYDCKEYGKKTKSEKSIIEDMQKKINKIIEDYKLMALFLPDDLADQEQVKQVYCRTLEIGRAKEKADELTKIREQLANKPIDKSNLKQNVSKCESQEQEKDQLYTRTFRVVDCTRQQIIDLGNYMNTNGIKFEKVEDK